MWYSLNRWVRRNMYITHREQCERLAGRVRFDRWRGRGLFIWLVDCRIEYGRGGRDLPARESDRLYSRDSGINCCFTAAKRPAESVQSWYESRRCLACAGWSAGN